MRIIYLIIFVLFTIVAKAGKAYPDYIISGNIEYVNNQEVQDTVLFDEMSGENEDLASLFVSLGFGINIPIKENTFISAELAYRPGFSNILPFNSISLNLGFNYAFDF